MSWNARHTWSVGEVLTAANHNANDSDSDYIPHEWDYAQITTDVTGITATTEGTATTVVTGNAVTYDGGRVRIEFQCSGVTPTSAEVHWVVLRDTTVLGQVGVAVANGVAGSGIAFSLFNTPSAGSHTYKVAAFTGSAQTITVKAGPGLTGNLLPAFLRVTAAKSNP